MYQGGADPYRPPLAFHCCLHTLVLQYRTASANETVTGTSSFLQFRGKFAGLVIGVKVRLHDAVFYGFPYKLRPKPKIAWEWPGDEARVYSRSEPSLLHVLGPDSG